MSLQAAPSQIGEKVASFEEFQHAFQNQDWERFWHVAEKIAHAISRSWVQASGAKDDIYDPAYEKGVKTFCKEFSVLFLNAILNQNCKISDERFLHLILLHSQIHFVLTLAGVRETDQLIRVLDAHMRVAENKMEVAKKILILLSIDGYVDLKNLLENMPNSYAVPALVGYLGHDMTITPRRLENKIALLQMGELFDQWVHNDQTLAMMNVPYFNCAYVPYDGKHDIKKHINMVFDRAMGIFAKAKIPDFKARQFRPLEKIKDKPVLLLVFERISEANVIHRTWIKDIKDLRKNFHTVCFTENGQVDFDWEGIFDEVVEFDHRHMDQMLQKVAKIKPDMAFYISLGMTTWSIALSNMRIAPLQAVGFASPCSYEAPKIDVYFGNKDMYHPDILGKSNFVNDTIPFKFQEHPDFDRNVIQKPTKDGLKRNLLKVAFAGISTKLNSRYIEVLKTIRDQADFGIEYHIFTHNKKFNYIFGRQLIQEELGEDVKVYGNASHAEYFERLQNVDIFLNPFPLGHGNTLNDILVSGKPCVGMLGKEPQGRTEYTFLKQIGLEKEFLAETEEEYIELFFKHARQILDGNTWFFDIDDIYNQTFGRKPEESTYGDAMLWLYENFPKIKKSKQNYFDPNLGSFEEQIK